MLLEIIQHKEKLDDGREGRDHCGSKVLELMIGYETQGNERRGKLA